MKVSQNAKFGRSFFQLKIKRKQIFKLQQQFQHLEYDMNQTLISKVILISSGIILKRFTNLVFLAFFSGNLGAECPQRPRKSARLFLTNDLKIVRPQYNLGGGCSRGWCRLSCCCALKNHSGLGEQQKKLFLVYWC